MPGAGRLTETRLPGGSRPSAGSDGRAARHSTTLSCTLSGVLRLHAPPNRVPNAYVLCVMLLEFGIGAK